MIHEYIAYLKDNPEHFWFKRKLYGWGWTPATREGWYVLLGYVLFLFLLIQHLGRTSSLQFLVFQFFLPIIVLTSVLVFICFKKGEKPKWQWGIPKTEKQNRQG